MQQFFTELGITNNEFTVYKTLLRLRKPSIRTIAEHSGINRGTTHELLKSLIKKGLVTHQLKGKRKLYLAEPPEKILQLVEQKQQALKSAVRLLQSNIIPALNSQRYIQTKPTARYYSGEEGTMQVLQDVLSTMRQADSKEYYVFSALPIRKYLYILFPNFTKLRVRYGIKVKAIALGEGGKEAPLSERRWLPADKTNSYASYIIIYADKLALISLTKGDLPYAVVIKETGITKTIQLVFNSLWQQLHN